MYQTNQNLIDEPSIKIFGWIFAIASLLALFLVAHHPVADMHDHNEGIKNLAAIGGPARMVHGFLIFMTLLFVVGFIGLVLKTGMSKPIPMLGSVSYLFGSIIMIFAALIDGFLIADIAGSLNAEADLSLNFIKFSMMFNQILAKTAFALIAFGILCVGIELATRTKMDRVFGIFSIVFGILGTGFILNLTSRLDVKVLLYYMIAQVIWNLCASVWMIKGTKSLPD